MDRAAIDLLLDQHVEEASHLFQVRSAMAVAPHVKLHTLVRWDERVAAHLDGLVVGREASVRRVRASLGSLGMGEAFVAGVQSLADDDRTLLRDLLAISEALPDVRRGLESAFAWMDLGTVGLVMTALLGSSVAMHRSIGLAAHVAHGVAPGRMLIKELEGDVPSRRFACAAIGLLAWADAPLQAWAASDPDDGVRFESARALVRFGTRGDPLDFLAERAATNLPFALEAMRTAFKVVSSRQSDAILSQLLARPDTQRAVVEGAGISGSARHLPWLLEGEPSLSRLAGEALSMMTGVDLAAEDLEVSPPDVPELDADDPVFDDPDDGLPWPDRDKVGNWIVGHPLASADRLFLGSDLTPDLLARALRQAYQRQRAHAAEHLGSEWAAVRRLRAGGTPASAAVGVSGRRAECAVEARAHSLHPPTAADPRELAHTAPLRTGWRLLSSRNTDGFMPGDVGLPVMSCNFDAQAVTRVFHDRIRVSPIAE